MSKNQETHILQFDGNVSLFSDDSWITNSDIVTETESCIQVITGNRPAPCQKLKRNQFLRRIRRNNGGELALFLPTIAVYNHRSIWRKIKNFSIEFKQFNMGIALHSEVWEKKEKKSHKTKIDEMFHMDGISYISTPRPGRRVGAVPSLVMMNSSISRK